MLKAVNIAMRVLAEKGLSASAVEKLIFVGGPTLAPYFRDMVKERMRIPCDLGMDPLTVVARGAAKLMAAGRYRDIAEYCLGAVKATVLLYHIWKERLAGVK